MTFIPRFIKICQLFRNYFFGYKELSNYGLVGMRKVECSRVIKNDSHKGRCYLCFSWFLLLYKVSEKPLIAKYCMKVEIKLCDLPHATTHSTFVNTTCRKERKTLSHVAG